MHRRPRNHGVTTVEFLVLVAFSALAVFGTLKFLRSQVASTATSVGEHVAALTPYEAGAAPAFDASGSVMVRAEPIAARGLEGDDEEEYDEEDYDDAYSPGHEFDRVYDHAYRPPEGGNAFDWLKTFGTELVREAPSILLDLAAIGGGAGGSAGGAILAGGGAVFAVVTAETVVGAVAGGGVAVLGGVLAWQSYQVSQLGVQHLQQDIGRAKDAADRAVEAPPEPEPNWTPYNHKHVAPRDMPWNKVVDGTKNGPAKYLPQTNVEKLEREVWKTGKPVTNGRPWKVQEFDHEIGASNGKSSRWMRVENSGNTIHGHPITEAEFRKLTKVN